MSHGFDPGGQHHAATTLTQYSEPHIHLPATHISRPPSRPYLIHSQTAPTGNGMSLSASSIGGIHPGHPGAGYKSHSLLPNGHHPSVGQLPPHSVSRLSHSFMTTFPNNQNHTRQSSLLHDNNTTTQKDISTTAPTTATTSNNSAAGAIAINSSLLTSTYHHALSLLCMLSVLMCILSASVMRPLEHTNVSTERGLRNVLSVCMLILSMCLDLYCLFVCCLQLMLALTTGSSAYLREASCSRNLAVASFLLSVPFFLTGSILILNIPLPASLGIVGVVFVVWILSSVHNVYVWNLTVQEGNDNNNNGKTLHGHIVQLSTLV
ncbi:uncharacterized protein LOC100899020 [Galendromus occidentalis]|uniref:Uncharacterized protein LOC100899020 n=1 Tax=Galendromus occidentalis TaxID=34638 RepID=A0AAJ6VUG8_9ACAR|nr:uncharacterized protein LOC100899020 [Galendromus occidentalis]